MPRENEKQAVRHFSEMPHQCLESNKNPDQVINSTRKKSRQDMEEVTKQKFQLHMAVEIQINRGWMEGLTGGASSSSGQGSKRTASQAGLPEDGMSLSHRVPSE